MRRTVIQKQLATRLGEVGGLHGFRQDTGRVLLMRHPLWTDDHPDYSRAFKVAQGLYTGVPITPGNPLRALRYPVHYL